LSNSDEDDEKGAVYDNFSQYYAPQSTSVITTYNASAIGDDRQKQATKMKISETMHKVKEQSCNVFSPQPYILPVLQPSSFPRFV
jgi:hypothetical protein